MSDRDIATLPVGGIRITQEGVVITEVAVEDRVLSEYLAAAAPRHRVRELEKILAVGVRGLTAMGVGATVQGVGEEVERVLSAATSRHEEQMESVVTRSRETLAGALDPDNRSSLSAQLLEEIQAAHHELLDRLDVARADSHTSRLVSSVTDLLGPEGELARRLRETFDATADDSAAARLLASIDARFRELHEAVGATRGAAAEAERGTAKGLDYEGDVVVMLRTIAAEIGGCTVEATGRDTGRLTAAAMVGDAVVTFADGTRVVVEAKNTRRITLAGKDGILEELDRAMANRDAAWAVCVSRRDAFPAEVGAFGVYGDRILVVDDEDGVLLRVALRWIAAARRAAGAGSGGADTAALSAGLDRIRSLAQRFSSAKRALSGVRSSVDQVRGELDALRTDLLDLVTEMSAALPKETG